MARFGLNSAPELHGVQIIARISSTLSYHEALGFSCCRVKGKVQKCPYKRTPLTCTHSPAKSSVRSPHAYAAYIKVAILRSFLKKACFICNRDPIISAQSQTLLEGPCKVPPFGETLTARHWYECPAQQLGTQAALPACRILK